MDKKRLISSFIVAACVTFIIFLVSNDFGITWDEPVYMRNGDLYVSWLKHPNLGTINQTFGVVTFDIHPPLRKLLAGLTHEVFTNNLRVIDNTRGYRISSLLFVLPFITVLTYIAIGQFGYAIGMVVPLAFSFLPHVLFLTPLVTLDYAVTALWFIAVVAAVKGLQKRRWLVVSGVATGLTMLTKLHGFLLAVPIVGYGIWYGWDKKNKASVIIKIAMVGAVAITVYVIGWPWLWNNTFTNLWEYFRLQQVHGGVSEYIFDKTYAFAPWWYTSVMFLTTTPALILVLFSIGTYATIRKGNVWGWVFLLNALYPILFFSLPGVLRYDWIRLFLPAFPFVCLVAGRGAVAAVHLFRKKYRVGILLVIFIAWLLTLYNSTVRIHPWESSYYNEFVGGISGAKKIGMESEFWGNAYLGVLPWMNGHKNDMMCVPFTKNAVDYYQAMGQIQAGVVFGATGDACRYEIILMRQGYIYKDPYITKLVTKRSPVFAVTVDGVPLVGVFDRTGMKN